MQFTSVLYYNYVNVGNITIESTSNRAMKNVVVLVQ
jgi:hypothetical protein